MRVVARFGKADPESGRYLERCRTARQKSRSARNKLCRLSPDGHNQRSDIPISILQYPLARHVSGSVRRGDSVFVCVHPKSQSRQTDRQIPGEVGAITEAAR